MLCTFKSFKAQPVIQPKLLKRIIWRNYRLLPIWPVFKFRILNNLVYTNKESL